MLACIFHSFLKLTHNAAWNMAVFSRKCQHFPLTYLFYVFLLKNYLALLPEWVTFIDKRFVKSFFIATVISLKLFPTGSLCFCFIFSVYGPWHQTKPSIKRIFRKTMVLEGGKGCASWSTVQECQESQETSETNSAV